MTQTLLFEIGLEELPSRFVESSAQELLKRTEAFLQENHLNFESSRYFATPRRLAVEIRGLDEKQPDETIHSRGPALHIAQDDSGAWTKAAEGFARGQGLSPEALVIEDYNGEPYIFASVEKVGLPSIEILKGLKEVIEGMNFPVNMKWGRSNFQYIRPVHWILALLDRDVIDFEAVGHQASNQTRGHRFLGETVTINHPDDYEKTLEDRYVIADRDRRQQMIVDQIQELEKNEAFQVARDQDLLDEVTDLVEYPTTFYGSFDESYLDLPQEVLITTMKDHQRYFYVQNNQGQLLPYFVSVRNGNDVALDNVIAGNEKVIEPRLHDAKFFFEEDKSVTLDEFNQRLSRVTFYDGLGTMGDKLDRLEVITSQLAQALALDPQETEDLKRAANLAKFDQETGMVGEFSELQGVMGQKYAHLSGENDQVALAIAEQYLPSSSQGALPSSRVGSALSIADKLDNLMMFFAAGKEPTGSNDPNALRRQALGILRILINENWTIDLKSLIYNLQSLLPYPNDEIENLLSQQIPSLIAFIKQRVSQILNARQVPKDIIEAVMASDQDDFAQLIENAETLQRHQADEDYRPLMEQLTRVLNLKDKADAEVQESLSLDQVTYETPSEKELFQQVAHLEEIAQHPLSAEDYYQELRALAPAIDAFFENNLVFADDEAIRLQRLALIQQLGRLILNFAAVDHLVIK